MRALMAGGPLVLIQAMTSFRTGRTSFLKATAASLSLGRRSAWNRAARFLTAGTRRSAIQVLRFWAAGVKCSLSQEAAFVTAGRRRVPMSAAKSPTWALRTWTWWARVSPSRPNFPWASLVCSMIRARVAAAWASWSKLPPTFWKPSSAALASIAACLRLTPYRSMGSRSPLRAEDRAATASAVVPPNMADRSAPRVMRSLVLPPSSLMDTPAFLSWAPIRVASSLYSFLVRPTALAAPADQERTWSAPSLKTSWTAPTDCSRSAAADTPLAARPPRARDAAPPTLARVAAAVLAVWARLVRPVSWARPRNARLNFLVSATTETLTT